MSVSDVIKGLLAMSGKRQAELTSVLGMSSNQAVNIKLGKIAGLPVIFSKWQNYADVSWLL